MPILKGWPCPRPPKLAMSPAAFTIAPQMVLARNAPSAFCAAHPFTYPVGSIPPGMAHGSNHPPDSSRAMAHCLRTSETSAGACALVISPRRSRLTGLCGCQVLNTASARCSMACAVASCREMSVPAFPSVV
jgi:hypothetical protein